MSPQRKVYETRTQKVGDFFIGVGLVIGVNVLFGIVLSLLVGMTSSLLSGSNSSSAVASIGSMLSIVLYCAPLVVNIGAIIYFSLTRYWIALGMLAVIAFGFLITLCLTAACFALIGGGLAGWFNNPIPTPIP